MNKQEQIKEMGQIICERSKDGICLLDKTSCDGICGWTIQAETIYNAGYRKVPEGAVVLTKEECEHKVILDEDHFERALNYERENARKETALKIRNYIKQHTELGDYYAGECYDELDIWSFDRFLKESFGVEVEE